MDVSDVVIASMELGIRSVSWEMVKRELQNDAKYRDLSTYYSRRLHRSSDNLATTD